MEGTSESAADKLVHRTPWWGISVGLHAAIALAFGWIVVMAEPAPSEAAVVVQPPRRKKPDPTFERVPDRGQTPLEVKETSHESALLRDPNDTKLEICEEMEERTLRGQNENFLTEHPFNSKNANSTIGTGGGAAGRKGGPGGGMVDRRSRGRGGPHPTQDAVRRGLLWLARHQDVRGSWSVHGYLTRCDPAKGRCIPNPDTAIADYEVGVSGLALLALLGAGYTHGSKEVVEGVCYGDVVRTAVQFLLSQQDGDGCIGPRIGHYMYNHCLAALAVCEAYWLSGLNLLRAPAQRAVDFLVAAQNQGRGWRYRNEGDNDTSVTGWAVMVFKSAEACGLPFPAAAYEGSRAWLDEVTDESYGRVGYDRRNTGQVYCPHNKSFESHESMTAIAVMCRIFMDKDPHDPRVSNGSALLMRDLPKYDGMAIDYYYWYYASLALFQYDGYKKGPQWEKWNAALTSSLVKSQNVAAAGCKEGSWEPVDRWSCEAGRVYATAINTLTLEVYYRYASVFGAR